MDIQDEKLMNVMFGRINDKLDSNFKLLHKDMEYVKKQTSKTNGTVADVVNRLDKVEKKQAMCPADDYYKFKEDMEVTHFYTKNPKYIKYTLVGIFLLEIVVGGLIVATKFI